MNSNQLDVKNYQNKTVYHPVMKAKPEGSKANSKDDDKGMSKETKILLSLAGLAVLAGVGYYGGKKGWFGDGIKKFCGGTGDNTKCANGAGGATSKINADGRDNLGYEISAPKIDDLTNDDLPDISGLHKRGDWKEYDYTNGYDKYFDPSYRLDELDIEYRDAELNYGRIYADLKRPGNERTWTRYKEVVDDLCNTKNEIKNKILNDIPGFDTLGNAYYICGGLPGRSVLQKRFFSIPGNHRDGYCCLDPLLYKQAREECIDTYFGYDLLKYMDNSPEHTNSPMLDTLLNTYNSKISQPDKDFIHSCVDKINQSTSHRCHLHDSALHAHELARLGKIFREAIGVQVK